MGAAEAAEMLSVGQTNLRTVRRSAGWPLSTTLSAAASARQQQCVRRRNRKECALSGRRDRRNAKRRLASKGEVQASAWQARFGVTLDNQTMTSCLHIGEFLAMSL